MAGRLVWIVNHYASSPDRAAGRRHYDLARQLTARGCAVTVFAAGFSHAEGREARLGAGRLYRRQRFGGVEFVWLRTVPYRGNSLRRRLNMISFLVVFIAVQARFRSPDVIIGSTVHPFAAFGAWIASRARRSRFVFEIRDLWPQTLVDLGALRIGSPGERLLRSLEALLVRRASVVLTLLPGMRNYLQAHDLPTHHVVYLPNGVDLRSFDDAGGQGAEPPEAVSRCLAAIARLREDGRFVFGYVGSFGRVNRADVIVRAAELAIGQEPGRIGVILVGDGPERAELERLAARSPGILVGPPIPTQWVPVVLRSLDATVVHATSTPVYRYGISFNKLFEYMAAARPIVFACSSAYDPVAANEAGLSVPPDDPQGLARALLAVAGTPPDRLEAMGAAGRTYVEREHNIERLAATLAAVVQESRVTPSNSPTHE